VTQALGHERYDYELQKDDTAECHWDMFKMGEVVSDESGQGNEMRESNNRNHPTS